MKLLLRLCAFALIMTIGVSPAYSVLDDYIFTQEVDEYTAITSGTQLYDGSSNADDNTWTNNSIGFTFYFNGSSFTSFSVSTNGYLQFGASITSTWSGGLSNGGNNTLAPLSRDLYFYSTNSAELRFQTTGTSPHRVCTIQWKNVSYISESGATYNFQIKLFEQSNNIQFVYGDMNVSTARQVQVGMRGSSTSSSDIKSRIVTSGTHTWSTSGTSTLTASQCNLQSSLYPDDGLVYEWSNEPMIYSSNSTTQISGPIPQGGRDQALLRFNVITEFAVDPVSATGFTFNTNGSDNASDIATARLYYTGLNTNFSTTDQYGDDVDNPNGTFAFEDEEVTLNPGNNYFWLAYDVASSASLGNVLDAEAVDVTVYTPQDDAETTYDAENPAPEGNRDIQAPLAGTYYIGVGEGADYPNFTEIFADANMLGYSDDVICVVISDIVEPGLVTANEFGEAGDGGYTWTIQPDGTTMRTISSSYNLSPFGFMFFNGTDNMIIDGSYDGEGKYLTFENTGGSSCITFNSLSPDWEGDDDNDPADDGGGCNDNTVKNCYIKTIGAGTSIGILFNGAYSNRSVIENNTFTGMQYGIFYGNGALNSSGEDVIVKNNIVGSDNPDEYVYQFGMIVGNVTGESFITNNTIFNIINENADTYGILTQNCDNPVFALNVIHDVISPNSYGYASRGIAIMSGNKVKLVNNEVYFVTAYGYFDYAVAKIFIPYPGQYIETGA